MRRGGARRSRHNNRSAEILATVRRGPFAKPTPAEQIECLFVRVPRKDSRKDFEKHALEHVLSFQRRVLASKRYFFRRGKPAPLGIVEDYWDRTHGRGHLLRTGLVISPLRWWRETSP